jgi:hypothetical protein
MPPLKQRRIGLSVERARSAVGIFRHLRGNPLGRGRRIPRRFGPSNILTDTLSGSASKPERGAHAQHDAAAAVY